MWQFIPIFLTGESPWTKEPDGLQSVGSQRVGQDGATRHTEFYVLLTLFSGSNITADGDAAMKLKDAYSLEEKL